MKRRVVVTGLGCISPLGMDVSTTWKNICAGASGVHHVDEFDCSDISTQIAATTRGFDASKYLDVKEARILDPFVQFGVAAAHQALEDANLFASDFEAVNRKRIGVALGSGIGGLTSIVENQMKLIEGGPRRVSPFLFLVASSI